MNTGEITFDVISDFKDVDSGFDVSKGREEGTTKHRTPKSGTKIIMHWIVTGISFFSRGHWVRGIIGRRIIKRTIKAKLPQVQQAVDTAQNNLFDTIIGPKAGGGK